MIRSRGRWLKIRQKGSKSGVFCWNLRIVFFPNKRKNGSFLAFLGDPGGGGEERRHFRLPIADFGLETEDGEPVDGKRDTRFEIREPEPGNSKPRGHGDGERYTVTSNQ
jgi:hypothetical protein